MVIRPRAAAAIAPIALAMLAACRTSAPPAAIDPALSARVPAATIALAGLDLDRVRSSPLYANLPPAALAFLQPFAHARHALIAWSGGELLAIARGVVPGATQIAPDVALSGAPNLIAAATNAHPPAQILGPAESVARAAPIWIALRGGIALPLEGNAANLNNLLRATESVTIAVRPDDPAGVDITAQCTTPAVAQHFEQSVRALASLAAATSRDPQVTAASQAIVITRADRIVRVALRAPLSAFSEFLDH
jgi:hypothetical protein